MAAIVAFMKFPGNFRWFGLPLAPLMIGASLLVFEPLAAAEPTPGGASAAFHSAGQGRKKKPRSRASGKRKWGKHHRRKRSVPAPTVAAPRALAAVVALSPGPAQTAEAQRSMDLVRRDQIARAESAARRAELTNRWETVSFLLSGVDNGAYPQAGFWKALAAYRRGDLDGGDTIRRSCVLPPADGRALDEERSVATLLASQRSAPPTGMQPAALATGPSSPAIAGVHNYAAYVGPGPTLPEAASRR